MQALTASLSCTFQATQIDMEPNFKHKDDTLKSTPHISVLQKGRGEHAKELHQKHRSKIIIITCKVLTAILDHRTMETNNSIPYKHHGWRTAMYFFIMGIYLSLIFRTVWALRLVILSVLKLTCVTYKFLDSVITTTVITKYYTHIVKTFLNWC